MYQIIKSKSLTWIDIKNPDENDLDWVKKSFKLHPLVLDELLPKLDYPRIENFGDYLFIVLFYPFFDKNTKTTTPLELDIVVSKDYIITSHYKNIVPLKAVFDKCNLYEEYREDYTSDGSGELVYRIIRQILSACFPKLTNMKRSIDEIEEAVYEKRNNKAVGMISLVQRDIIGFQRIIEPQELVLENLSKEAEHFFDKKLLPYFNSLNNLYKRVASVLNSRVKTLKALDSTNEALLTTRTNEIIKLLTIFSVIVFPLNLFAAIFGMNTRMPLVNHPYGFWVITGMMGIGVFLMLLFFRHKKWTR